jgi:hypothetical protein
MEREMPSPIELETRLHAIGQSLKNSGKAYALLGLGSVGLERSRMDAYSDLDFFAIVKEGSKNEFIQNLFWLTDIHPMGYSFQNTVDGHKFLYQDGIFCEFAVFEPHELKNIPFAQGQVIWNEEGFDTDCLVPTNDGGKYQRSDDTQWILGEALTNLYVGLGRYQRGEKLSAMKFVQNFSLDRIVDLMHSKLTSQPGYVDQYMPDRRIESRLEGAESLLSRFCQGYDKTIESALAQLQWLEENFEVNPHIAQTIRSLATES